MSVFCFSASAAGLSVGGGVGDPLVLDLLGSH